MPDRGTPGYLPSMSAPVPSWRDALLPAGVVVVATIEALSFLPARDLPLALGLQYAACAVLVLRRHRPLFAGTTSLLLLTALALLGPDVEDVAAPILIIFLSVVALGRYVADLRGLVPLVPMALSAWAGKDLPDITDVVFISAVLLAPYGVGRVLRALDVRNRQLVEQSAELLRLSAKVRDEAVSAERARIARELHDVIAHSVSAMVVQASAAQDLVTADPARSAQAMQDVAGIGRRALAETGRLLHLIRDTHDELGLAPDAGLEQLDDLVERFRRSGLHVSVEVDGSLDGLPAGVDLSGYRIVQEALTNALKHAVDGVAHVTLRRSGDALRIDAENRARPDHAGHGSGLGLVGMTERVQVFGGDLSTAFTDDERYVLSARLPLEPA
jgi:signal transduction histidine kinase